MGYTNKISDLQFAVDVTNRIANNDELDIDCDEFDVDVDPVNAEYYSRYCSIS